MGAQAAHARIITRLECSVRLDVRPDDERLHQIAGLAIGAGLIKTREDHDDRLAIDGGRAIVNNQAVGVRHGECSVQMNAARRRPRVAP
jgi:hypothetical protein